jgi:hypothetical protein
MKAMTEGADQSAAPVCFETRRPFFERMKVAATITSCKPTSQDGFSQGLSDLFRCEESKGKKSVNTVPD